MKTNSKNLFAKFLFLGLALHGTAFFAEGEIQAKAPAPTIDYIPESGWRNLPETPSLAPFLFEEIGKSADVGIYVDKGSWTTGREHMMLFMQKYNVSYRKLTAQDILNNQLKKSGIKVLMMPGGESWTYLDTLGPLGAEKIKEFVQSGGGYFGVCAGAFYAVANRDGGRATGPYGIGLLDGTAYDGTAHETKPFIEGMMDFAFFLKGFQSLYRIVLIGGPSFRYSAEEAEAKQIQVLANFQEVNEPAMILYRYGRGKVFLSGPHLEVEESLVKWGDDYQDPDSEWPVMHHILTELF